MSNTLIWVIVAVVLVIIVIAAVVIMKKRSDKGPEPTLDPPYGQKKFPDPTENDPQLVQEAHPDDVWYPDGPENIQNPDVDNMAPGQSTPRNFPPPGPPRQ